MGFPGRWEKTTRYTRNRPLLFHLWNCPSPSEGAIRVGSPARTRRPAPESPPRSGRSTSKAPPGPPRLRAGVKWVARLKKKKKRKLIYASDAEGVCNALLRTNVEPKKPWFVEDTPFWLCGGVALCTPHETGYTGLFLWLPLLGWVPNKSKRNLHSFLAGRSLTVSSLQDSRKMLPIHALGALRAKATMDSSVRKHGDVTKPHVHVCTF